jgi:ketosteroid isomerase-like protein
MSGNVELARSLYNAFAAGDIETVLGAMDASIEWREAESNPYQPTGAPWIGPQAVVDNLLVKLATEWDAFTVHPKEFSDLGDGVLVEGRYTGTYKATGKSLDCQMAHVWKIRDGKLTSFQQYVDTAQLQDVIGSR